MSINPFPHQSGRIDNLLLPCNSYTPHLSQASLRRYTATSPPKFILIWGCANTALFTFCRSFRSYNPPAPRSHTLEFRQSPYPHNHFCTTLHEVSVFAARIYAPSNTTAASARAGRKPLPAQCKETHLSLSYHTPAIPVAVPHIRHAILLGVVPVLIETENIEFAVIYQAWFLREMLFQYWTYSIFFATEVKILRVFINGQIKL